MLANVLQCVGQSAAVITAEAIHEDVTSGDQGIPKFVSILVHPRQRVIRGSALFAAAQEADSDSNFLGDPKQIIIFKRSIFQTSHWQPPPANNRRDSVEMSPANVASRTQYPVASNGYY